MRVGIVGAGLMGRWHAEAARRAGGRVVGVVDVDRRAAEELARRHGGAEVHADVDAALRAGALDVVHVCTPLEHHARAAGAALESGVHALVEKPLTQDAAACERLQRLAAERGALLCPVHQFPFQRAVGRVAAVPGLVDDLLHLEIDMCSAGGVGRDAAGQAELLGEMLPHPLSLIHTLLPGGVEAVAWHAERLGTGELRLLGRSGSISIDVRESQGRPPTECSMRLRCRSGTWHVDLFHDFASFHGGAVSRGRKVLAPFARSTRVLADASANLVGRTIRNETAYPGLRRLVSELYRAVRGEGPVPIEPAAALALARTRDALMELAGLRVG